MGREREPDPGMLWMPCDCAEIDPSDRPCVVCFARFPPDGIDDESAATWEDLPERARDVIGKAEHPFVPDQGSMIYVDWFVERDLLERASVRGPQTEYTWGYQATPRGRRLIAHARRIAATTRAS